MPLRVTVTLPDNMPSTLAREATDALLGALASELIREAVSSGFAPT